MFDGLTAHPRYKYFFAHTRSVATNVTLTHSFVDFTIAAAVAVVAALVVYRVHACDMSLSEDPDNCQYLFLQQYVSLQLRFLFEFNSRPQNTKLFKKNIVKMI